MNKNGLSLGSEKSYVSDRISALRPEFAMKSFLYLLALPSLKVYILILESPCVVMGWFEF